MDANINFFASANDSDLYNFIAKMVNARELAVITRVLTKPAIPIRYGITLTGINIAQDKIINIAEDFDLADFSGSSL